QDYRKKAEEARRDEQTARDEAREYRRQMAEAGRVESEAESEAKALEERLEAAESKGKQLLHEGLLRSGESADTGVSRWTGKATDHETAVERLDGEITRIDEALEAFDSAIAGTMDVL